MHLRLPEYAAAVCTRQEGIEPPTHGLEGRCSIRLSYWRPCVYRVAGIREKSG